MNKIGKIGVKEVEFRSMTGRKGQTATVTQKFYDEMIDDLKRVNLSYKEMPYGAIVGNITVEVLKDDDILIR